jgi:prepilin-type N-terminal cleavage/methylation domain-containing protein
VPLTARRAPGFSLLEVVVTLAVVSLGIALASRLILEAQLGLLRAQAELENPLPRYALTRLRADVEGAAGVTAILPGWRSSPLELTLADGSRISWRWSAEELERVTLDATGAPVVRHVAIRDVVGWRWRAVAADVLPAAFHDLVDVEITHRLRDTTATPLYEARRTWSPPPAERTVWARVGIRATP